MRRSRSHELTQKTLDQYKCRDQLASSRLLVREEQNIPQDELNHFR